MNKISKIVYQMVISKVTKMAQRSQTVLIYTYGPSVIILSVPFHSQKCPSLDKTENRKGVCGGAL